MAKRRKKDEEEDGYEYEFPEFDRKEYMLDEIRKGKCVYISVALAPIFSIIALFVFNYSGHEALLGFLVGLTGIAILKTLFQMVGIEVSELGKKEWAMSVAMYLFTFLAVWVILMNPPFSDFAAPTLDEMDLEFEEDNEIIAHEYVQENITEGAKEYNMTITATISDNVEVDHDSVRVYIDNTPYNMTREADTYQYHRSFDNTEVRDGSMALTFKMEDVNGNEATVTENVDFILDVD
ncbi:MAG: hypothetical protein R6W73_08870 [Candidatus Saliniplasma sp.]